MLSIRVLLLRFVFPIGWLVGYSLCAWGQSFSELGDFVTESKQIIRQCRIGYRTVGKLNADKSNAVLFPTYFTGQSDALLSYIGGKDKMLDSTRYFIILADALGNGISSSPSNSALQPGGEFPLFTIADMVRAHEAMISKEWGIKKLHAVVGISMGGMQAFQWMATFPEKVQKIISIVGTPRIGFSDLILWQSEIRAIEHALQSGGNLRQALESAVLMHAFALYTPAWRNKNQKNEDFQRFVDSEIEKFKNYSPLDWAWQAKAMMAHDVYRTMSADRLGALLKKRGLIIYAVQDMMVSPQACMDLVKSCGAQHIALTDDCGHLAPGCNMARLAEQIQAFLQRK